MVCSNCGAELKEGCVYCSICGKEQLINGLSDLEDDYLRSILKEEAGKTEQEKKQGRKITASPHLDEEKKQAAEQKKKIRQMLPMIIVAGVLAAAMITGISVKTYIDYENDHSYDFQMDMAEQELKNLNFEKALGFYSRALTLQSGDITARMKMAEIYLQQKNYDAAAVLLKEIINLDKNNKSAYENLISIYDQQGDFHKIKELSEGVEDESILELFADYQVLTPVFYPSGGTYDTYVMVTLISVKDEAEIYYTLDGTDPIENGVLYESEGIRMEKSDSYVLKAVCKNERGIYSDVVEHKYKVSIQAPGYPNIDPNGGSFTEPTYVTIDADEECSVYYTWDGTDPNTSSECYSEPILVPEGNNILSLIVYDSRSGLSSKIYRANYIYDPPTEPVSGFNP